MEHNDIKNAPLGQNRSRQPRTFFTREQLVRLEKRYSMTTYITRDERCQCAQENGLSEDQVKIWFQNRRAKEKRLAKIDGEPNPETHMLEFLRLCIES